MRSVVACSCKSSDEKLEKLFHRFRRAKSSQNSDLNDGNDAARMGVRMHFLFSIHITFKIDFIHQRMLDPKGFDAKANLGYYQSLILGY